MMADQVKKDVSNVVDDVIKWRRYFHENPELGFDLDNTIKFIGETLTDLGIYNEVHEDKSYVVGYVNKDKEGKTVAIRADMDALPVQEDTGLEFSSKVDGKMHACGHDSHMAMLMGLAKTLDEKKDQLNGRVKFIFQPAEELGTGSTLLIEDGVLDDVDEIIGVHAGCLSDEAEPGDLVFSTGSLMATMDRFKITIKGKGAHGSTPQDSIDPITVAAYIITGLQEILSRETDPRDPGVISVCTVDAGNTFNVIPDSCVLEGTTRVFTDEMRDIIEDRIGEVAEGIAKTMRADIEYEYFRQPPPLVNDEEVAQKLIDVSNELYPDNTLIMKKPAMPGEDFAWYLKKVPGAFFFLHNPLEIEGQHWAHHNSKFALDEEYFERAMGVMLGFVEKELA